MTITLQRLSEDDGQPAGGFGVLKTEFGNLPLQQLCYHTRLIALATHTTIAQTYYNPFDEPIEAQYIFPLEMGHAVVACQMRVGERVIQAQLKERAQARQDYRRALRLGHRAALLEENRPETFAMSVGNIPPGEAVQIVMQTVSQLSVTHGEWTLRLPLVVAPRYTSGIPLPRPAAGPGVAADTQQVPDASTVTPPTLLPGFLNPIDLRLAVDIDMGQLPCSQDWIDQLKCSLHTVLLDRPTATADQAVNQSSDQAARMSVCSLRLLPGERVNRDFILRGRVLDQQPSISMTCELDTPSSEIPSSEIPSSDTRRADATQSNASENSLTPHEPTSPVRPWATFGLTIVPPRNVRNQPRQVFFLLDRSGSMEGWKYQASQQAIAHLMDQLTDQDHFQLAVFNDGFDQYKPKNSLETDWVQASRTNCRDAITWLTEMFVNGGTELGEALKLAMQRCTAGDGANAAIVLITDGQITGEDMVLRIINTTPESQVAKVYCLGVDRAVNASALRRITDRTGGTFELVESQQRLEEVIQRFASEIGAVALSELSITSSTNADLYLAPSPSMLYAARSITIYGRYELGSDTSIIVSAKDSHGQSYEAALPIPAAWTAGERPLLKALWGKHFIRKLEDKFLATGFEDDRLRKLIIESSLECQVLSRLTAYVAVDEAEIVTDGQQTHSVTVPSELPEGWAQPLVKLDAGSLLKARRGVAGSAPEPVDMQSMIDIAEPTATALLQQQTISPEQLEKARGYAKQTGMDLCAALVKLQYASPEQLARAIAEVTRVAYLPVSQLNIDDSVFMQCPESVARENHVLPIAFDHESLTVVMANPNDFDTIEKLRFILNKRINTFCGSLNEIHAAIDRGYGPCAGEYGDSIIMEFTDTQIDFTDTTAFKGMSVDLEDAVGEDGFGDALAYRIGAGLEQQPSELRAIGDEPDENAAPVIRLVGLMIQEAVQLRASHILLLLDEIKIQVQYIVDGQLFDRDAPPKRLWQGISNRLKVLAKIELRPSPLTRSGELHITVGEREVSCKVHTRSDTILIEFVGVDSTKPTPEPVLDWFKYQKPCVS